MEKKLGDIEQQSDAAVHTAEEEIKKYDKFLALVRKDKTPREDRNELIQSLENQRKLARQELEQIQKQIDINRSSLIDDLQKAMIQKSNNIINTEVIFRGHWTLVEDAPKTKVQNSHKKINNK